MKAILYIIYNKLSKRECTISVLITLDIIFVLLMSGMPSLVLSRYFWNIRYIIVWPIVLMLYFKTIEGHQGVCLGAGAFNSFQKDFPIKSFSSIIYIEGNF